MMREFAAALRLELSRMLRPAALLVATLCAVLSVRSGYTTLENHAMILQSAGEGATAQDLFFGMLCDGRVTSFFLPLGLSALCGGIACRDNESGMRDVLLSRMRHRGVWWASKAVCVIMASVGYLVLVCVGSWAYDCLVNGMPMSDGRISEWLTYPGGPEAAPWELYTNLRPIPETWNVYALDATLVVLYGLLYAGFVLLAEAACLGSSHRWAPHVLFVGALMIVQLIDMVYGLGFVYEPLAWMRSVPWERLPLRRLCVCSYPLGEGFCSDVQPMSSLNGSGQVQLIQLNSVASGLLLMAAPLALSLLWGAWRSRKSCAYLPIVGGGQDR